MIAVSDKRLALGRAHRSSASKLFFFQVLLTALATFGAAPGFTEWVVSKSLPERKLESPQTPER